jgi:hypothetical protein
MLGFLLPNTEYSEDIVGVVVNNQPVSLGLVAKLLSVGEQGASGWQTRYNYRL